MLREIDHALRTLVDQDGELPAGTEIVFDAPTTSWAASRSAPTLDVYLYDIRADLARAHVGGFPVTDDDGRIIERHPPPRFFRFSYLVTAWTNRPEDEHAILDSVLTCLLRRDHIPADLLTDTPVAAGFPASLDVALPPPDDRSLSDVWSALGGELKPSLEVVVSAPVRTGRGETAAAPADRASIVPPPADKIPASLTGAERRTRRWNNVDDRPEGVG